MTASKSYSRIQIALHWLTLALLIAVYACIELREMYPRGSDVREALKMWHFTLGMTVFFTVWVRLAFKLGSEAPPIVPPVPRWQVILATIVEFSLYVLMVVLPLLGWLTLSAEGDVIPFFGLQLPALVTENEVLAERVEEVHETLATIGYFLIGLHAAAALFHHYIRRDNALKRMLSTRT